MNEEKDSSIKSYDLLQPWKTLDPWQIEYINTVGNCFLLCSRQSGKSAAMSIKIGECAIKETSGGDYLVIAYTEKQAYALFFKVLMYLEAKYPDRIARGNDKPTMHEINIKIPGKKNEYLTINCHAAGINGDGLRHYTLKRLFIDEAAPMSSFVWIAVEPMLSISGGVVDMSSTPRGKEGFFWECSKREDFKKFYVSAEDCPRHKKEFLKNAKATMTPLAYAQEYLAIFLDEFRQLFPTELINSCMTLQPLTDFSTTGGSNYLGVDIGGMGKDPSILLSGKKISKNSLIQTDLEITQKTRTTETINDIKGKDRLFNYKKIYIDNGGMGVGVFDTLLNDSQTKRKVVPINNSSKFVDSEGKKSIQLAKVDLYMNLKELMERGELKIWKDPEMMLSLTSVQTEWHNGKLEIFGDNIHVAEALGRMCWCMKDKSLNICIDFL